MHKRRARFHSAATRRAKYRLIQELRSLAVNTNSGGSGAALRPSSTRTPYASRPLHPRFLSGDSADRGRPDHRRDPLIAAVHRARRQPAVAALRCGRRVRRAGGGGPSRPAVGVPVAHARYPHPRGAGWRRPRVSRAKPAGRAASRSLGRALCAVRARRLPAPRARHDGVRDVARLRARVARHHGDGGHSRRHRVAQRRAAVPRDHADLHGRRADRHRRGRRGRCRLLDSRAAALPVRRRDDVGRAPSLWRTRRPDDGRAAARGTGGPLRRRALPHAARTLHDRRGRQGRHRQPQGGGTVRRDGRNAAAQRAAAGIHRLCGAREIRRSAAYATRRTMHRVARAGTRAARPETHGRPTSRR